MNHQIFAWGSSKYKLHQEDRWIEFLCITGLFLAALVLFSINLGSLPLRDWDEGTVAQVAKEIYQTQGASLRWLFPTLWGEPYLNKPPLIHNLIAVLYSLVGINEWTTRLPGAMLTAISVPLLYGLGREIFTTRLPAFFAALIYLTLLPVVRHGRLAMLDGAILCFGILTIGCVLRSRRDLRWALGVGLGLSLICLTKGMMGFLLGAIAFLFLAWDTPRLLTSMRFWLGLGVGCVPAIAWYIAQWTYYGQQFTDAIFGQNLQRIWDSVDSHRGPIWYYVLEILKYAWPWLIFSIYGFRLAWTERNWSWAKLVLVWGSIYLAAISLMETKLPWYVMPIYPVLALAGGAAIAEIYNWPSVCFYPRAWTITLGLLAGLAGFACIFIALDITFNWLNVTDPSSILIIASFALTMTVGTMLITRRDRQFISILFWGMYVSLVLFVMSPNWIWELNEAFPVKPVATIIKKFTPPHERVYTSFAYERPSLNFYSDRQVVPATPEALIKQWQNNSHPYLLLDPQTLKNLKLSSVKILSKTLPNWILVTKESN
jgi:4-amino-4-deoxy-L-arabinose transferase-like glycosyltransferase